MTVSMLMEKYQVKYLHQNHHQHAPSPAALEYHTGSQLKYHTQNQRAMMMMVHMAEYPVYASSLV
jgi:hypothetical protein